MADKLEIKLHHGNIGGLLKGSEIAGMLGGMAADMAADATANAGPGAVFGHAVNIGPNRARAGVWTQNAAAMRAEASHRVLTRAIDSARR